MSTAITPPQLVTAISVTESVTTTTATYTVQQADRMSIQCNATDATPGAKSFVAADVTIDPANTITIASHGFVTGLKVALSGTNLPTGLSATNYWVIVVDSSTIKLADSLAHALAGTVVVITDAGTTADAALTPAALGSSTVTVKASLDGVTYSAYATPKTVTITGTSVQFLDCGQLTVPYIQIQWTAPTAGALTLAVLAWFQNTQVKNNS
jgi:hypothetical protein